MMRDQRESTARHGDAVMPAFCGIERWTEFSSMSRSATYEALGRGDLRAIKIGKRTAIDVEAGLAWLRSLPAAEVRAPRRKSAA